MRALGHEFSVLWSLCFPGEFAVEFRAKRCNACIVESRSVKETRRSGINMIMVRSELIIFSLEHSQRQLNNMLVVHALCRWLMISCIRLWDYHRCGNGVCEAVKHLNIF